MSIQPLSKSAQHLTYGTVLVLVSMLLVTTLTRTASLTQAASPSKSYIVVYKDSVTDPEASTKSLARQHGLTIDHSYGHAIKGFAATIPAQRLEKIKQNPQVAFVSEDKPVAAYSSQYFPTGVARINAPINPNKGAGIGVAILDTGIDLTHPEFAGRIVATKNCTKSAKSANDDNGHGTHVAGTVGAADNTIGVVGVAPSVSLVAVKVLNRNASGTWSAIICGINWVTQHAATYGIKVVNMSLGGAGSSDNNCGLTDNDALHKAICNSTAAGLTYVVAAGNNGANASGYVPAAYDDTVITVSALADSNGRSGGGGNDTYDGADDTFASFSNYGSVVDLAAPGVAINSTSIGGWYDTYSGTSMASPHVAGSAALYLKSHPGATWTEVLAGLIAVAEPLGAGHTDPSGLHPEPVVLAGGL